MKIDFILQSDFPKDSDMVESFECQQTQTNRCVKKAKKKIVFNHMQVSMQRIKMSVSNWLTQRYFGFI